MKEEDTPTLYGIAKKHPFATSLVLLGTAGILFFVHWRMTWIPPGWHIDGGESDPVVAMLWIAIAITVVACLFFVYGIVSTRRSH